MKVELHNIVAECPSCHGSDFEPQGATRELISAHTPMLCTRCAARSTYLQLLVQIGDKAIARSLETLARIRAQRAKLKKPEPQNK